MPQTNLKNQQLSQKLRILKFDCVYIKYFSVLDVVIVFDLLETVFELDHSATKMTATQSRQLKTSKDIRTTTCQPV